jgi:hypothetical protein
MTAFFFSKQEILARRRAEIDDARARGAEPSRAGMNLALIILGSALYGAKQWSGDDYAEHPIIVGMTKTRSTVKQIIGILHDVVEDSDWTLDDMRTVGFSERIVRGVEAVTKRDGEQYLEFIERCSLNSDGIDVKINDLEHNSTHTRNNRLLTEKQIGKQNIYILSYNYLVAVKKGQIEAGSSIYDFMKKNPGLDVGKDLWEHYSARPYYRRPQAFPVPQP